MPFPEHRLKGLPEATQKSELRKYIRSLIHREGYETHLRKKLEKQLKAISTQPGAVADMLWWIRSTEEENLGKAEAKREATRIRKQKEQREQHEARRR